MIQRLLWPGSRVIPCTVPLLAPPLLTRSPLIPVQRKMVSSHLLHAHIHTILQIFLFSKTNGSLYPYGWIAAHFMLSWGDAVKNTHYICVLSQRSYDTSSIPCSFYLSPGGGISCHSVAIVQMWPLVPLPPLPPHHRPP